MNILQITLLILFCSCLSFFLGIVSEHEGAKNVEITVAIIGIMALGGLIVSCI